MMRPTMVYLSLVVVLCSLTPARGLTPIPHHGTPIPNVFDCHDGRMDNLETDVDCGGVCAPCPVGKHCKTPADCETGWCIGQVCKEKPHPSVTPQPITCDGTWTGTANGIIANGGTVSAAVDLTVSGTTVTNNGESTVPNSGGPLLFMPPGSPQPTFYSGYFNPPGLSNVLCTMIGTFDCASKSAEGVFSCLVTDNSCNTATWSTPAVAMGKWSAVRMP